MKRGWVLLAMLLGGCSLVGQGWERPALSSPESWSLPMPAMAAGTTGPEEGDFWSLWGDEQLVEWIRRALLDNREVRLAAARIAEARALTRVAAADGQPALDAELSVLRDRASEKNRVPMLGMPNPVTLYQVGFDARWELDLFGRLGRQREAVEAELLAARQLWAALQISLAAEVAVTYCDWRAAQAKAAALQRQVAASRELLVMVRARVQAGMSAELDGRRAEDQALQIEARLPPVQAAVGLSLRRLGILTGGQVDSLLAVPVHEGELPVVVPPLPAVLPAGLLDRRPDLLAAEARAHAAQARIGVAEGEEWPRLTLAATLGSLAIASGNVLSGGSLVYTAGPRWQVPLFHGGLLTAQVDAARAKAAQEVLAWEKAAVDAVLEVETAALRQQEARDRHLFLSRALAAQRHTLALAMVRYQRGMSDFAVPLEVARQLAAMEIEVIDAQHQVLTSGIALYKALGGGWQAKQE
ncbi:MAG: TolC family protein [Magnetococcus sp. DMHC-8]